jgi:uncharacterized phage protein (TIGR01671 family)
MDIYRAYHKELGMIPKEEYFTIEDAIAGDLAFWGSPSKDFPLKAFTFMRSLNLQDKNKTEIFFGDILKYGYFACNDPNLPWDLPEVVNELDITTQIDRIVARDHPMVLHAIYHMISNNPDVIGVEIIGNVHEDPDLLEVI